MKKICMYLSMIALVVLCVFVNTRDVEASKKKLYTVKGSKITVKAKNNKDITEALDAALKAARDKATNSKPITVIVPKGTYKINEKGLHIYSNTTLDLSKGVTLKYSGKTSHPMLATGTNGSYKGVSDYNNSKKTKGYNGFKNIKIKGGKFVNSKKNTSTTMRLFHAKNITLEGVTFSGGGGVHQLEVVAIDGFYVKKCKFQDFGDMSGKSSKKMEALQMDIPCSKKVYPSVYQDGTVMKNVEITGCTFKNVPRGIGSHTLLNGAYFKNVKINNNTFKNLSEEAIVGLNYINCEIKGNKIENCGAGILFQFFKATPESICTTIFDGKKAYKGKIQHNAKTVIMNNVIKTKYTKAADEVQAIKVYGLNFKESAKGRDGKKIPKGNYYISGVTVANNKITTAGYGIHMMDTRDCTVTNNTIVGKGVSSSDPKKDKYDGIIVENYAKNVSVTNNTIKNMKRNGIFVQESAYLSELSGNVISDCERSGINFYMKSGTTTDVTRNTISKCDANGILLSGECNVPNIVNNTLSLDDCNAGIAVFDDSTVGKIKSNKIKNISSSGGVMESGIKLTTGAKVAEISDNEMTAADGSRNVAGTGIMVYSQSQVTGNIASNIIGKVEKSGISITTNAKVGGSIDGNTIKNAGTNAIQIYSGSTVGKDISNNTIEVTDKGISVSTSSRVGGVIKNNTIGSCRSEYYIDSSSYATIQ